MLDFLTTLKGTLEKKQIPPRIHDLFLQLHDAYVKTLKTAGISYEKHLPLFITYLELVKKQLAHPYQFEPYHKKITHPFDHYRFGIDLFTPMVDLERSTLLHSENLDQMEEQLRAGQNVVLFANHQTEVDPVLIHIALEKGHPQLAAHMIFVAGDRVILDPMAVPMSLGCNLLCIYSKRYIDIPPEKKEYKLTHNQRTMKRMRELLKEGGKIIYVAPSGGRDRMNAEGKITLSPFDPSSLEMFRLMAKQAGTPTHFYPLALKTFDILPPPQSIAIELGEDRVVSRQPAHFAFGDEIDMENFPGSDCKDRHEKRNVRAHYIFNLVQTYYHQFP